MSTSTVPDLLLDFLTSPTSTSRQKAPTSRSKPLRCITNIHPPTTRRAFTPDLNTSPRHQQGMSISSDMSSPPNSTLQYMYGDAEQYFDHTNSESQSSMNSPYDFSYIPDFGTGEVYSSPERETESPEAQSTTPAKGPAKRKRENRYKNAPPSVLSRRRAQNRASQRAYRERKDQRIKDLEQLLGDAKQRNDTLSQAYAELHQEYIKLKAAQQYDMDYAAESTGSYFDPTLGALAGGSSSSSSTTDSRIDLDLFVYPDMGGTYNV